MVELSVITVATIRELKSLEDGHQDCDSVRKRHVLRNQTGRPEIDDDSKARQLEQLVLCRTQKEHNLFL